MDMKDSLHPIIRNLLLMPPVQAMGLEFGGVAGERLRLGAPLAANVNDKGCAFGGSLASVMTLAAWALMSIRLEDAGHHAEVYVQDSTVRYLAPLYGDIQAEAWLQDGQDWGEVIAGFAARGKARARLQGEIRDASGQLCCSFEGRFVALAPRD